MDDSQTKSSNSLLIGGKNVFELTTVGKFSHYTAGNILGSFMVSKV